MVLEQSGQFAYAGGEHFNCVGLKRSSIDRLLCTIPFPFTILISTKVRDGVPDLIEKWGCGVRGTPFLHDTGVTGHFIPLGFYPTGCFNLGYSIPLGLVYTILCRRILSYPRILHPQHTLS